MKISVRTLLALSDPACEPEFRSFLRNFFEKRTRTHEDREEAKRLIHRIQKITGIPLRAPERIDGSEELDPNEVAEYLDHKLSAEEESRFESLFLSSDVFLAELVDVSSFLNHSLGQVVGISDEIRTRLYDLRQKTPEPPPAEKAVVHQYSTQKKLQEGLEEWKWERLNRLKNIIVLAIFLTAGLLVWSNQEAINQWMQKNPGPETADLLDSSCETVIPTQSVLESVEWNESQDNLPFSTKKLESTESVMKKTTPKL